MSDLQPDYTQVSIADSDSEQRKGNGGAKGSCGTSKYAKFDREKRKRVLFWVKVTVFFLGVISCVSSWTVPSLRKVFIRDVALWRWCLLITSLLAGLVMGQALQRLISFLLEYNISMKENFIYYLVGTIETASVSLWIGFMFIAFTLVVDQPTKEFPTLVMQGHKSEEKIRQKFGSTTRVVTLTFITILLGSLLFTVKNVLMMVAKSSFHIRRFFDRVKKKLHYYYVIQTLLKDDPPTEPNILDIEVYDYGSMSPFCAQVISKLQKKQGMDVTISKTDGGNVKKTVRIDLDALNNVDEDNVSCWAMKHLIDVIKLGKPLSYVDNERKEKSIENEDAARSAADFLFSKVFPERIGCREQNIEIIEDYFKKRGLEVQCFYELADTPQLDEGDQETIVKEVFRKCVVRGWRYHKSVRRALIDNKKMFTNLNRFVTAMLVIITILIWLVLVRVEIRRAMVIIGSAVVGSAFICGDFCKKLLDAFAFVFVFHRFDVGDYCLIEGAQVIIHRMHLLDTVAFTLDNERRHYSNSTLCDLSIVNFTRSPPHMGDSVIFYLDFSTTNTQIVNLERQIKHKIFKEEQHYWLTEFELVTELESQDKTTKIKATLRFKHKTNFHELRERESRKSKLVLQLKTILDDLKLTIAICKAK